MLQAITYSQQLPGWCTAEKAMRMYDLVWELHEKFPEAELITAEIGVFGGKSLTPMAFAHKGMNRGYTIGFDSWDNITPLEGSNAPANNEYWANVDIKGVYKTFVDFVVRHELHECCRWFQCRSDVAAQLFSGESLSLLHVDGNHNSEVITTEMELWTPKLRSGGILVVDDYDWVETQEAYARIPQYGFKLLENHTQWAVFEKL